MALPKSHRLSLRFNRERLTKTGKTFYGKFFTVVIASLVHEPKQNTPSISRFAILLSKKTASLATDRNRIKRITSGLLENIISSIPHKDYLIIPKKQVLTEDSKILSEDIQTLLKN